MPHLFLELRQYRGRENIWWWLEDKAGLLVLALGKIDFDTKKVTRDEGIT